MEFLREIEEAFDRLNGRQLAAFYAQKIDAFLIELFNSIPSQKPLALIAVGGYGRAELAPFSDIDIMFFARDKTESKKVEAVLYKLWDSGLTIGHSFRTAEDCITEAKKDLGTQTSLLESRFIAGDAELYHYFKERVYSEIAYKRQRDFIRGKLKEMEKRHVDYGGSVFLLEPNVKEGQGCLRDVHTILWLSRVVLKIMDAEGLSSVISSHDFKRLIKAYDFLLKVRFCLHLLSGRRNDVLSFNTHDYIAQRLGFRDSKKFLGSERFMRYFYLKASAIREVTVLMAGLCARQKMTEDQKESGIRKRKATDNYCVYNNVIIPSEKDTFRRDSDRIIEAFYAFSKTGRSFSHGLREELRKSLLLIRKKARRSQSAIAFFFAILKSERIYGTLREMHDTGVLGRFIPEFGALISLVVYEPYHRYTVDEHTLIAIKNLELLTATKYKKLEHLAGIMRNIKDRDVLFMSLLFHDIGKAAGKRHGEEGYKRLKNIVERFNLDIEKRQRIELLVRNHVLMSTLALRRETEDPEVIAQFAEAVGDEESLNALYLMTYADMSAVNPYFWTEWKAYLLRDLYERTLLYLRGVREDPQAYVRNILSEYAGAERDGLRIFIDEMPERYLLSTPPERIYDDYRLACEVKDNNFTVSISGKPDGTTELTVGAWDSPGLFSRVVGFLSSKWMNIVRARLYTGKQGLVIDKIQISNWKELWWDGMDNSIINGLRNVVLGGSVINLERVKKEPACRLDVFIELDNETSKENTIIEFFSHDRHGLLYDVSRLFYDEGLNIVSAKINTEADIAQDIFYIQREGKMLNGIKAVELISSLWETLKK